MRQDNIDALFVVIVLVGFFIWMFWVGVKNNTNDYTTTNGIVNGINIPEGETWNNGDTIYLTTNGTMTNIKP